MLEMEKIINLIKQRFRIFGNSAGLNQAIEAAVQVAPTDLAVLVTGESGTGKEVFAQIVHQFSVRKHGQYIALNCAAIPEGTIDSELFGHEKDSFTGANKLRRGIFETAKGGTIFLDEVGELPLSTQARLLRVLENGEFFRVGSSLPLQADVRIVAATNLDMPSAIEQGKFREDLYYRLCPMPIHLLPLRDRKEDDIFLLFRYFVNEFVERNRLRNINLTEKAKKILLKHSWPGNIRELKHLAERLCVTQQSNLLVDADILSASLSIPNKTKEKFSPPIMTGDLTAIDKKLTESLKTIFKQGPAKQKIPQIIDFLSQKRNNNESFETTQFHKEIFSQTTKRNTEKILKRLVYEAGILNYREVGTSHIYRTSLDFFATKLDFRDCCSANDLLLKLANQFLSETDTFDKLFSGKVDNMAIAGYLACSLKNDYPHVVLDSALKKETTELVTILSGVGNIKFTFE